MKLTMTTKRHKHRAMGLGAIAMIALAGVLALGVPAASAQDSLSNPSAAQYKPQSQVQGTDTTAAAQNTASQDHSGGSSLPITGMDLVILAGAAILLMGTGLVLRRLSAPRRHHT